ncbi:MAG: electron transfer flavoprotein subunit beta/FixA family protein [Rhodospirillaceae bacterium]|nr:electron transfer flavoprotein subunit beta/FixA family protein [Rhodospirillaceae bacterium]
MKILVPVKRVLDAYVPARVKPDHSGVVLDNVKMSMNPFCEIAVEAAIRLKEAGQAEEVILVSAGPQKSQDVIRTGLAMGADRGILIQSDEDLQPLAVAKLLKAVVDQEGTTLVLMGKQAIDGDNNQTGQMLSALLGWAQATFCSKLELAGETLKATREVDGGLEHLELNLPAVVTVDLRLNEPRYATLPNIMKAKKKPLATVSPADLGVDVAPRFKTVKVTPPADRAAGVKVGSAAELVEKLRSEAKVI